ncbi:MAG TPA: hypothetical protein VMV25_01165 [Steroidobacteraceae bacterium]|nr:hypothetical protein [Steroidobacteraceae bacterium]
MTEGDLDILYTQLCTAMTGLGEANASLFLARFALLAIARIDDAAAARGLIADAAEQLSRAPA